ncbi:MAG: sigma-70 family RNA polymerase sigma factor [Eubacterium sp.]|nr:sigma-70 family RNA polymerase sigma factor [Eubacterium sp.]
MDFEKLLCEHKSAIERFVYYRISNKDDADDILQEIYITAFQKFSMLNNIKSFKPWIIEIAKNKCRDYYRKTAKNEELSFYDFLRTDFEQSRYGFAEQTDVFEVLSSLKMLDKEILYLFYYLELSQKEIANRLEIPVGTVKSRLYNAKQNFKEKYPYSASMKGEKIMKLPEILPNYKIVKSDKEPFSVVWEELMGWLIVPKLNEKISWGLYDFPERICTEYVEMQVTGKAEVHGVEGVEIKATEYDKSTDKKTMRHFVAQLTDTHCRILAESHIKNEMKKYYTFLDGDEFIKNWGFGEDNCGKEINIKNKNRISKNGNIIKSDMKPYCMDIVGRYTVTIANREFDTVCLMDIESYDTGVVTEQFIDKNGKTVLWRRFNADDWAYDRFKMKWSEKLPDNEQIIVDGKIYVHWYDCISDYIL